VCFVRIYHACWKGRDHLMGGVESWMTPMTRDHHPQGPRSGSKTKQTKLSDQVRNL
jgi:hypothetical protein